MKLVVTKKAFREFLHEVMFNEQNWQTADHLTTQPIQINPVVDPSSALTDPYNKQIPNNRQELKMSLNAIIDEIPDDEIAKTYDNVKNAITMSAEADEEDEMKKELNVENTLRMKIRKMISEDNNNIESVIRMKIRKIFAEAAGAYKDTGLSYSGDMTAAPAGFEWCENCEGEGEVGGSTCTFCRGTGKVKKDPKYITSKETGGASVADMVAAGIPQGKISGLMKSAMAKFKSRWPKEQSGELDIALLSAVPEYIEYLKKQSMKGGEPLTPADIQLMNDHPDIVLQSDEFREFFNKNYTDY